VTLISDSKVSLSFGLEGESTGYRSEPGDLALNGDFISISNYCYVLVITFPG
jgi:hypothetical protein